MRESLSAAERDYASNRAIARILFTSIFRLEKVVFFSRKTAGEMALQSVNKKVIFRIYGRGRGWAFSSNDFVEDFSRSQIDYALSELCREGTIRRVCRGIYDYPKFSELL